MEVNSNAEFVLLDLNSVSEQLDIPLICMVITQFFHTFLIKVTKFNTHKEYQLDNSNCFL